MQGAGIRLSPPARVTWPSVCRTQTLGARRIWVNFETCGAQEQGGKGVLVRPWSSACKEKQIVGAQASKSYPTSKLKKKNKLASLFDVR